MSRTAHEVLKHLSQELSYQPEIVGAASDVSNQAVVIGGMGGSALPALLLQLLRPELTLDVHRGYDLPARITDDSPCIAISHSGNTVETLSFARQAHQRGHELAVITTGGKLLEFARQNELAYVQIPTDDIQPRYATGYLLKALCELLGLTELGASLSTLQSELRSPEQNQRIASELVDSLEGKLPVIYAPAPLAALAHSWKIKFNETAKVPAFMNVFPELNHNEFTGFDTVKATRNVSENICFVMIDDQADNRISQRMDISAEILRDKGYDVLRVPHGGDNQLVALFDAVALADWTTLLLAEAYGVEPFEVPMVEDLKVRLVDRG